MEDGHIKGLRFRRGALSGARVSTRAMHYVNNTELFSHVETRRQFNGRPGAIKLRIDVHQDFYL
jgi:hypothetical protein